MGGEVYGKLFFRPSIKAIGISAKEHHIMAMCSSGIKRDLYYMDHGLAIFGMIFVYFIEQVEW
ncbi:hypothetical protein DSCW_19840 [Desulfosarcina widdelii]|uniref:Uncharacterized protein n=1 Tax=Desulfosarcina widdelii TaxID=947919 RepID=A0A5K7ZEC8_9BACT|nr:hypothetical protein DSCW_19840 [Desulfosarcina widdelii]